MQEVNQETAQDVLAANQEEEDVDTWTEQKEPDTTSNRTQLQ